MADYSIPQYPHFNRRSDLSPVPSDLSQQSPWSDLLPPNRGFAFAAQWDSDAGTITLSKPQSITTSKPYPFVHDLPLDVDDDQSLSDTRTIHPLSVTDNRLSINTGALTPFDQTGSDDHSLGSAVASSAECGPDAALLYTRRSRRSKPQHYSCFDTLDAELSFDATKAFVDLERIIFSSNRRRDLDSDPLSVEDEGSFDGRGNSLRDSDRSIVFVEFAMRPTYPTTMISTSNYVYVPRDFHLDDVHTRMGYRGLRRQPPLHRESPARPQDVLRREYNYLTGPPRPPEPDVEDKIPKVMRGFRGWNRRRVEDDRWVMVDVTQVVTQSYVEL